MSQASETQICEAPYTFRAEYLYTYGEVSKFFAEVRDNKALFGTKCTKCGKVWMPPRANCSDCYAPADWIGLSGKGTVASCTFVFYAPATSEVFKYFDLPYILAVIQLDGADTCLIHSVVVPDRILGSVKTGMRVKVAWREQREGKVTDFYFVPDEEG